MNKLLSAFFYFLLGGALSAYAQYRLDATFVKKCYHSSSMNLRGNVMQGAAMLDIYEGNFKK